MTSTETPMKRCQRCCVIKELQFFRTMNSGKITKTCDACLKWHHKYDHSRNDRTTRDMISVCECGERYKTAYKHVHLRSKKHFILTSLVPPEPVLEYTECKCGSRVKSTGLYQHHRTMRHIAYVAKPPNSDPVDVELLERAIIKMKLL